MDFTGLIGGPAVLQKRLAPAAPALEGMATLMRHYLHVAFSPVEIAEDERHAEI